MNYNELIINWHSKSSDGDYFSGCVFEYLAFIGFLKRIKFIDKNSDSEAVRALKHSREYRELYLEKIKNSKVLITSWQTIMKELDDHPLGAVDENSGEVKTIKYWKCSHEENGQSSHECGEQGIIRNLEDWENMVEFWHSIRNNLFHAAKNPQDERDQILIENGYKTLSSLVQIFLGN